MLNSCAPRDSARGTGPDPAILALLIATAVPFQSLLPRVFVPPPPAASAPKAPSLKNSTILSFASHRHRRRRRSAANKVAHASTVANTLRVHVSPAPTQAPSLPPSAAPYLIPAVYSLPMPPPTALPTAPPSSLNTVPVDVALQMTTVNGEASMQELLGARCVHAAVNAAVAAPHGRHRCGANPFPRHERNPGLAEMIFMQLREGSLSLVMGLCTEAAQWMTVKEQHPPRYGACFGW